MDSAPASRPTFENSAPTMRPTAEGHFANQIGPAIAADIDNSGVGDRPRKIPEIRIQLRSCHSCDTHVIYRRYTRASIMIRGPVHKLVPPYHMMLNALT